MSLSRTIIAGLLIALVNSCGPGAPDEEQIRARIEQMTTALAERDVGSFMAPLADDFSGVSRNIDRRGARLLLRRELRAHEQLRARVFDVEIELQGDDRATATLHAALTGGSGLIPERGRWYRVKTGWRKDGSDWMLISASWENAVGRP